MPHLLNFLKGNGTLFTNDHTILISHTAGGILSSLTGLYPDRNGQTVSNSYDYFKQRRRAARSRRRSSTGRTPVDGDERPAAEHGHATAARRRPRRGCTYTRAGCDVGGVSARRTSSSRTTRPTPTGDMTQRLRRGLARVERGERPNAQLAQTDFVGIAIHCAQAHARLRRQRRTRSRTTLPDEPGRLHGFKALFGAKYVDPAITGGQPCVKATRRHSRSPTRSATAASPASTGCSRRTRSATSRRCRRTACPVTYALHLGRARQPHARRRGRPGPGEARLQAAAEADYDDGVRDVLPAARSSDGIDKSNTLFVVTVDEGDHFAGGVGHAAAGDGSLDLRRTRRARTRPDDVPGEPDRRGQREHQARCCPRASRRSTSTSTTPRRSTSTASRHRTDPAVRQARARRRRRDRARPVRQRRRAQTPIAERARRPGRGEDAAHGQRRSEADADVHDVRQRRLLLPDVELARRARRRARPASTRASPGTTATSRTRSATPGSASSGPASRATASTDTTWTDHVDVRPTINALLGLSDDYDARRPRDHRRSSTHKATPRLDTARRSPSSGDAYKQINAPFGQFAHGHARRVDDGARESTRRAEVRLDRDVDRQPDARSATRSRARSARR